VNPPGASCSTHWREISGQPAVSGRRVCSSASRRDHQRRSPRFSRSQWQRKSLAVCKTTSSWISMWSHGHPRPLSPGSKWRYSPYPSRFPKPKAQASKAQPLWQLGLVGMWRARRDSFNHAGHQDRIRTNRFQVLFFLVHFVESFLLEIKIAARSVYGAGLSERVLHGRGFDRPFGLKLLHAFMD
jgi:hypothetical protein